MHSRGSLFVLSAAAMLYMATAALPAVASEETAVTCRVESPVDGSFWIGTAGDGLFRLGRTGRTVRYTAEDGQLGSNYIKSLVFDNQKQLWILDESGVFRTYSSLSGFKEKDNLPAGIYVATQGVVPGEIIFAADAGEAPYPFIGLYALKTNTEEFELLCSLDMIPQSLCLSNNADEVWAFAENCVLKCSLSGAILKWEDAPGISDLLPFEFVTNSGSSAPRTGFLVPLWLLLLLVLIAVISTWFIQKLLLSKRVSVLDETTPAPAPDTATHDDSSVQEPSPAPVSSTLSDALGEETDVAPVKTDGAFTKRVRTLIKENISDPGFDVESIAALTGLSRIHVNRKLKAEGSDSPSSLIKDMRMSMASKLLKQGKLTVSQISSQCGFRTPSYFATAFKDYYGVSPSEFIAQSDSLI